MPTRLPGDPAHDYQVERHNSAWSDHIMRTYATAAAIAWLAPDTVMDPACGDASIVEAAYRLRPFRSAVLADISIPNIKFVQSLDLPWARTQVADIYDTFQFEVGWFDVIVLTEVLEHLEDPTEVLRYARQRGNYLVASSPIEEPIMGNPEHIWSFSQLDYHEMMVKAGWAPQSCQVLTFTAFPYTFQIWTAS